MCQSTEWVEEIEDGDVKLGPGRPGGPDGPGFPGAPRLPIGPCKPIGPGSYSTLTFPGLPLIPWIIMKKLVSDFPKYMSMGTWHPLVSLEIMSYLAT